MFSTGNYLISDLSILLWMFRVEDVEIDLRWKNDGEESNIPKGLSSILSFLCLICFLGWEHLELRVNSFLLWMGFVRTLSGLEERRRSIWENSRGASRNWWKANRSCSLKYNLMNWTVFPTYMILLKLFANSSGIIYLEIILLTSKKRSPSIERARVKSIKKPQLT